MLSCYMIFYFVLWCVLVNNSYFVCYSYDVNKFRCGDKKHASASIGISCMKL